MRIAMVSYNGFVDAPNGWNRRGENEVFLLQNQDENWGVPIDSSLEAGAAAARQKITTLWDELMEVLTTLDKVVMYVGSTGAERVIELAAKHNLRPEQAIFVYCDCDLSKKRRMLREFGLESAAQHLCDCGGHDAMRHIFIDFLATGRLP